MNNKYEQKKHLNCLQFQTTETSVYFFANKVIVTALILIKFRLAPRYMFYSLRIGHRLILIVVEKDLLGSTRE